ncbi:MAG: hypothetical protein OES13_00055 [Acidimicrobiia bacterium]|nr:hypothetical protein [Acidimicrobiia bacterium]
MDLVVMPARRALISWLPVGVLVAFVAVQIFLMTTVSADPQSGSGFAMFSTVDILSTRRIVATGIVFDEPITFDIPDDLQEQAMRLRSQPTTARATQLARELAERQWDPVVEGAFARPTSVEVTVWGITAEGRTLSSRAMAAGAAP